VAGLALIRLLEVVGEAANRVSEETRSRHDHIPWGDIIGMRNRLIHGYDVVDQETLWNTLTEALQVLVGQLEAIAGSAGDA